MKIEELQKILRGEKGNEVEKRSLSLTFQFTPEEFSQILNRSGQAGLSIADFIKSCVKKSFFEESFNGYGE